MLTLTTVRALRIIRDHEITMPKQFAKLMWPDSDGWETHVKCGPHGSHRGGGMYLAAGGYLGKLEQRGLIKCHVAWGYTTRFRSFELTTAGKEALEHYAVQKGM
jgi:hypothetical protein